MEILPSEYQLLVDLARIGLKKSGVEQITLKETLDAVDKRNGITRYVLSVQWQDAQAVIPNAMRARFPRVWPEALRATLEKINEPFSRSYVEQYVAQRAAKPVNILVTPDPDGLVGWATLDQFFEVRP